MEKHCTRCGAIPCGFGAVLHYMNARHLCINCLRAVLTYPQRCTECDMDGYPLTHVSWSDSSNTMYEADLCPNHLASFDYRSYKILIDNGDDLGSEHHNYEGLWREVGVMVSQPDMHQYFPLIIEKVNQDYDIHETIAVVRLP